MKISAQIFRATFLVGQDPQIERRRRSVAVRLELHVYATSIGMHGMRQKPNPRVKARKQSRTRNVVRIPVADRREQLIDATIQVMRRDGVRSVTMRAVATEANASLAAVHYCFESKNALLGAAIGRWLKLMINDAVNVHVNRGIRSSVQAMLDAYWAAFEAMPEDLLAQFELALWAVRREKSRDLASTIYPMYIAELKSMLAKSLSLGGETCQWDLERLSRALLAVIDGCSLQYLSDPTSNARSLCGELVGLLLESAGIARSSSIRNSDM
ncbi:TetR/AcrR family transcriptional regulator [Mesorhizobium escarrei]|uniref:TetR/AcrR family transcriptional regulator n=1 Tax=Mesorhizobium escarrei TaxID=666018 RepID=UPI0020A7DC92|nr:TetR family transcriptional regulator [Mesorhizobium escarrei]